MAIITPAQSLCFGGGPAEPGAKTPLEPCARAAAVIDWDRHRRNPPVDKHMTGRKHRGVTHE